MNSPAPPTKPTPKATRETRPYWEGCAHNTLRYQFCTSCNCAQFPPGAACRRCSSSNLDWRVSAGLGTIYSQTTVHRAPLESFRADVPYVIALVDLDESFRIMVNLPRDRGSLPFIGARVRIFFEQLSDEVWLPQAELIDST